MQKLHYFVFKNQSIYIRCHEPFDINLGEGTPLFTQFLFILLFGGEFESRDWLPSEVRAFKISQSCLYKRSLMERRTETKRGLRERSKKCMILKSGSDAPYTERQYVKFSRTKSLNRKWSVSPLESIAPFQGTSKHANMCLLWLIYVLRVHWTCRYFVGST